MEESIKVNGKNMHCVSFMIIVMVFGLVVSTTIETKVSKHKEFLDLKTKVDSKLADVDQIFGSLNYKIKDLKKFCPNEKENSDICVKVRNLKRDMEKEKKEFETITYYLKQVKPDNINGLTEISDKLEKLKLSLEDISYSISY